MEISDEIKRCIDKSVLCWSATSSMDNIPNVSPKEIFSFYETDQIIIANIASPQTVKNIKANENVAVSLIDILVQKGFQIKGKAKIISKEHAEFKTMESVLVKMTGGKFPFQTITCITAEKVKPIIAPRYLLYPETTEEQQVEGARKSYGL